MPHMSDTRQVRIAIADDHQIFRDGLRRLLESEPGFEVIAEGVNGLEAARIARELTPDVMLLDVAMPRMGGVEALATMSLQSTRVILLTAAIDPGDVLRAIQLGARGVVMKDSATRLLIDGINRVMDDKYVIGTGVADDLAQAMHHVGVQPTRQYGLTPREIEIVSAIVAGDSNRDIADRVGISLQTVKHHLTSIFDKTGVSSRLELALFAIRHGIAAPD
jgi:two-component system, NarL family, nitrate/nitrite response regulator NarL